MAGDVWNDNAGATTGQATAFFTDTPRAGDILSVYCRMNPVSTQTITGVTDNRGNTYTQRGNPVTVGGITYARYAAFNLAALATTVTLTASGACNALSLWCWFLEGCATASPFDATNETQVSGPGTGTDALVGTVTNTKQPAVVLAFAVNTAVHAGGNEGSAPTGWTRVGSEFTFSAVDTAIGEWKRFTTNATQSCQFTASTGADNYLIFADAYLETGATGSVDSLPYGQAQRLARNPMLSMSPRSSKWRRQEGERIYSLPASL